MNNRVDGGYRAQVTEILECLAVAGLNDLLKLESFAHIDVDSIELAMAEFARFVSELIVPTDAPGDTIGSQFDLESGVVRTPPGFVDAYRRYVESGWGALQFPTRFGGGGFPAVVGLAFQEIFASANLSLSLNPTLTQGAIELLIRWGSETQHLKYLPKLLTGEWTGTMNLTEPEAGSDLGQVRVMAHPQPDGSWLVSGTKIFISWGEHDLAENIIHLVLARTPDAPLGTSGISLFLVPKFRLRADGSPGDANNVRCAAIEEKLGIHASPTCTMLYEGAHAELVGELHRGLHAMFTMMNVARLSIGIQGPAVADRAFQHAVVYATERLQGRPRLSESTLPVALIEHPDVRRMLLHMRTLVIASRLLTYTAATFGDLARNSPEAAVQARGQAYFDLLTPIAKAWSTDNGVLASSLGLQILGGAGYIEESGMAQRLRDSRIGPIYEGTNGIQAIDLVTRKVALDDGRAIRQLLGEIGTDLSAQDSPELRPMLEIVSRAALTLSTATDWLLEQFDQDVDSALAGATSYLELAGITIGGWLMARRGIGASRGEREIAVAEGNFFATEVVAKAPGLLGPITAGSARLDYLVNPHFG